MHNQADYSHLIEMLLGGIPLSVLEFRLRPHSNPERTERQASKLAKKAKWHTNEFEDYSTKGFLGRNESLTELVIGDYKIIKKAGSTYLKIADELDKFIATPYSYKLASGYSVDEAILINAGVQSCPWGCDIFGGNIAVIRRDESSFLSSFNDMLSYFGFSLPHLGRASVLVTGLLPHLVREHYFFEGRKTRYRADPKFLIHAFNLERNY